mmetsp:Transcript_86635/g.240207  ORF Transcript_86635/g.240207 Transcript_86635/m.240207 type:complete len:349 (-) Transcript_86635:8-1054(-)
MAQWFMYRDSPLVLGARAEMPRAAYAYTAAEAPAPTTEAELEVESRVDPEDGEVRTFKELQHWYAGFYSPQEIADYWQNGCMPYMQGFFQGSWTVGSKRHSIKGPKLHWHLGRVTIIRVISRNSFTMELDGEVFHAQLQDGGSCLAWSDGEAWYRSDKVEPEAPPGGPAEVPPPGRPSAVYAAGQPVKYFSASAAKWIAAVVRGQHRDGTYELDVKRHAKPEHIRPASSNKAVASTVQVQDSALLARWKMQLPRALAEWAAGDHKGFDSLLAARIMATPQASYEDTIHDMLADALAAAPTVGIRAQELEEALEQVEKITKAMVEADVKLSKHVKRPIAGGAIVSAVNK